MTISVTMVNQLMAMYYPSARLPWVKVHDDSVYIPARSSPTPSSAAGIDSSGSALEEASTRAIGPAEASRLADGLLTAGVGARADWGMPPATDLTITTVSVDVGTGRRVSSIYGLGDESFGGLNVDQLTARRAVQQIISGLQHPTSASWSRYVPAAVVAVSQTISGDDVARLKLTERTWPGPRLDPPSGAPTDSPNSQPGGTSSTQSASRPSTHCVILRGGDLARSLPAIRAATVHTAWRVGKQDFSISFRLIVPGDDDCAA